MPTGEEHVQATLSLCQQAQEHLASTSAPADAGQRLAAICSTLILVSERFFIKSRLCLPFAARCEEAAKRMDAALTDWLAQPGTEASQRFESALQSLEKAARTLDDRSTTQGMTIT